MTTLRKEHLSEFLKGFEQRDPKLHRELSTRAESWPLEKMVTEGTRAQNQANGKQGKRRDNFQYNFADHIHSTPDGCGGEST